MQGCDDFQPFFGLIASTVARSRLRQEQNSRDIQSRTDQSSSEEEAEDDRESEEDDRESSPNSKSSASHDSRSKESERSEMSCEWMFEGFWYFLNTLAITLAGPALRTLRQSNRLRVLSPLLYPRGSSRQRTHEPARRDPSPISRGQRRTREQVVA